MPALDDLAVERVLRTAQAIPPGHVAAYGQIGAIVGLGPRQVRRIMADWGSSAPWWRVTNAAGELPPPLLGRAREHWDAEGIAVRADGRGCRMAEHRADLARLRRDAEAAWAGLPER